MLVLVHFLIAALASAQEHVQVWEDFEGHNYVLNDTYLPIWNRLVDWMLEYTRVDWLIDNSDWAIIGQLNKPNDVVCHVGRVGHVSSVQRAGPPYIYEYGITTALKVNVTLRDLEFEFSNCTFWPQRTTCPCGVESQFKFDFSAPNGIFRSNSIRLEISWNKTESIPSRCNPRVNILAMDLGQIIMRNPLMQYSCFASSLQNSCNISDRFVERIVPEIRNSTVRMINVKLTSILEQIANNVMNFCALYIRYGLYVPFWSEGIFKGLTF